MNDTTRRRSLGVAGASAAAAGATVVPGAALAGQTRRHTGGATESVVGCVGDVHAAEVTLLVGEREVVVHDRDLVDRLLDAAGR